MESVKTTMKHYYHTEAESVRFKDITSSAENRAVLHRIKNNDPSFDMLIIDDTDLFFGEENVFIVGEGDDLEWLGYFIGENKTLTHISFCYVPACKDQLERLFNGIKRNSSIKSAYISLHDDRPSDYFSAINLPQVTDIEFFESDTDKAPYIAIALQRCESLKEYTGPVTSEIAESLAMLPMLEEVKTQRDRTLGISRDECLGMRRLLAIANNMKVLNIRSAGLGIDGLELLAEGLAYNASLTDGVMDLSRNAIGDLGLQALASSLARNSKLRTLHLTDNNIGDAGLEALADSLSNNGSLRELSLSGNVSITEIGVAAISGVLTTHTSCLEDLRLEGIGIGGLRALAHALGQNKSLKSLSVGNIGDESACALANALGRNTSLKSLNFDWERITSIGWIAFFKSLCDTSSPHSIHLSNHALIKLGYLHANEIFQRSWLTELSLENLILLCLGANQSPHLAAKFKILAFFPHIDLTPLFKWRLKALPFVMGWFAEVAELEASFETRKLSAVYQFVRGMSCLVVDECKDRVGQVESDEMGQVPTATDLDNIRKTWARVVLALTTVVAATLWVWYLI